MLKLSWTKCDGLTAKLTDSLTRVIQVHPFSRSELGATNYGLVGGGTCLIFVCGVRAESPFRPVGGGSEVEGTSSHRMRAFQFSFSFPVRNTRKNNTTFQPKGNQFLFRFYCQNQIFDVGTPMVLHNIVSAPHPPPQVMDPR